MEKILELFPEYPKYRAARNAYDILMFGEGVGDGYHGYPRAMILDIVKFHRLAEEATFAPVPKYVIEMEQTLKTHESIKLMVEAWEKEHPYIHAYYLAEKSGWERDGYLRNHFPELYEVLKP